MRDKKGRFIKGHTPHPNWKKVWIKPRKKVSCPICKGVFKVRITSNQLTCSKICGDKLAGEKRSGRGVGRSENNKYYRSTRKDRKYIHRKIMEEFLGRELLTSEQIHHKNGNKKDNRIENLELMTNSEHQKLHALEKNVALKCALCTLDFKAMDKPHFPLRFCSISCRKKSWRRRRKEAGLKVH